MKEIPRGKYTKEFRQEAVKLVIEEKLPWGKAGQRLNLAPSAINHRQLGQGLPERQAGRDRQVLSSAD